MGRVDSVTHATHCANFAETPKCKGRIVVTKRRDERTKRPRWYACLLVPRGHKFTGLRGSPSLTTHPTMSDTLQCESCGESVEVERDQQGHLLIACDCTPGMSVKVPHKLPSGWTA